MTLHARVLTFTTREMFKPFKKHLISGIPEPPANGSRKTMNHATNTNATLHSHSAESAVPYGITSAFSCSTSCMNYSIVMKMVMVMVVVMVIIVVMVMKMMTMRKMIIVGTEKV